MKSIRGYNYIFLPKDKFIIRSILLAAIVLFLPRETPKLYLIPSISWLNPNALLVSRNYEGKKSKPEWGLNISKKNDNLLEEFSIQNIIKKLWPNS